MEKLPKWYKSYFVYYPIVPKIKETSQFVGSSITEDDYLTTKTRMHRDVCSQCATHAEPKDQRELASGNLT